MRTIWSFAPGLAALARAELVAPGSLASGLDTGWSRTVERALEQGDGRGNNLRKHRKNKYTHWNYSVSRRATECLE